MGSGTLPGPSVWSFLTTLLLIPLLRSLPAASSFVGTASGSAAAPTEGLLALLPTCQERPTGDLLATSAGNLNFSMGGRTGTTALQRLRPSYDGGRPGAPLWTALPMADPLLLCSDRPVCSCDREVLRGHIAGESHRLRHSPRALCITGTKATAPTSLCLALAGDLGRRTGVRTTVTTLPQLRPGCLPGDLPGKPGGYYGHTTTQARMPPASGAC